MTAARVKMVKHLSLEERVAEGRQARGRTSSHSAWRRASDRPDPVALLEEQRPEGHPVARLDGTLPGPFEYDVSRTTNNSSRRSGPGDSKRSRAFDHSPA